MIKTGFAAAAAVATTLYGGAAFAQCVTGVQSFQQLISKHAKIVSSEARDNTVTLFVQDSCSGLHHCSYKADLAKMPAEQQSPAVCAPVR